MYNSNLNLNLYKIFYDVALFLDDKKGTFFKIPDNLKKFNMINTLTNKKSFTYVI